MDPSFEFMIELSLAEIEKDSGNDHVRSLSQLKTKEFVSLNENVLSLAFSRSTRCVSFKR
jgi:hypothetical protein